jgi:UDP:flavonoid glycosyltransferase YjiC (YdhE family)
MSRILAYTSPAHGHLFPLMAILEELRRRGHDVVLRTLAGEVAKLRSLGFEAKPIEPSIEALRMDDWKAKTPVGRARGAMGVFSARAGHDAADLKQAIEEERPDAVLVDIMSWGALAAAEAWGGPWASFSPLPLALPSRDAPPFGPGLRPARHAPGRLRDRVCAVPFGRDQFEVARRVEVAGAGSRLPSWQLRPGRLRNKVREAISRRDGAQRVAVAFAATGGPPAAADAFERRLGLRPN